MERRALSTRTIGASWGSWTGGPDVNTTGTCASIFANHTTGTLPVTQTDSANNTRCYGDSAFNVFLIVAACSMAAQAIGRGTASDISHHHPRPSPSLLADSNSSDASTSATASMSAPSWRQSPYALVFNRVKIAAGAQAAMASFILTSVSKHSQHHIGWKRYNLWPALSGFVACLIQYAAFASLDFTHEAEFENIAFIVCGWVGYAAIFAAGSLLVFRPANESVRWWDYHS